MKLRHHYILYPLLVLAYFTSCKRENQPQVKPLDPKDAAYVHQLSQALTEVIVYDVFAPPVASRIYAYTHLSLYEALRLELKAPSMAEKINGLGKMPQPKSDAALNYPLVAAQAFVEVSKKLVFSDTMLQRLTTPIFAQIEAQQMGDEVENASITYGNQLAAAIAQRIQADNYKQTRGMSRYSPQRLPGTWEPTPPEYMDATEPHWSKILPWTLQKPDQFKPVDPTPYNTSPQSLFFKEMLYVYETKQKLTEEQKAIALFWDDNPFIVHNEGHLNYATKKISPGGHWIGIARLACETTKADPLKTSKTYALTAIALADGFISCWDEKYQTHYIRPETAIQALVDPKWRPLIQTPPFPEYTSGHSVISGAASSILTKIYGENFKYTDNVLESYGMTARSFESFNSAAKEASMSRLYGGIHFLPALENGMKQGEAVGEWVWEKLGVF
jgi:PAP2 superfamily